MTPSIQLAITKNYWTFVGRVEKTWFSSTSSVRKNEPKFQQIIVRNLWKEPQNVWHKSYSLKSTLSNAKEKYVNFWLWWKSWRILSHYSAKQQIGIIWVILTDQEQEWFSQIKCQTMRGAKKKKRKKDCLFTECFKCRSSFQMYSLFFIWTVPEAGLKWQDMFWKSEWTLSWLYHWFTAASGWLVLTAALKFTKKAFLEPSRWWQLCNITCSPAGSVHWLSNYAYTAVTFKWSNFYFHWSIHTVSNMVLRGIVGCLVFCSHSPSQEYRVK